METKTKQINLPILKESPYKISTTQLCYRTSGIRLEYQQTHNKHIFHNYGHGAAGISLAYGCAYITVKSISAKIDTREPIQFAVIGSGIVGIIQALELSKRGFKVTIYAEQLFQPNQHKSLTNQRKLNSQGGKIVWFPNTYYWGDDNLKHELLSKLSYDYYRQSMKLKRYRSIKPVTVYEKSTSIQQMKDCVSDFIFDTFQPIILNFDGQLEQYIEYETLLIDSNLLMEELYTEAILRNIKFVAKSFKNISDLESLKESCIVNCTSLGSQQLFQDHNVYPVMMVEIEFLSAEFEMRNQKKEFMIREIHPERNTILMSLYVCGNYVSIVGQDEGKKGWQYLFNKIQGFIEARKNKAKL